MLYLLSNKWRDVNLNNEITVKLSCNINEFIRFLNEKDFVFIEKYIQDDTYFIHKNINIKNMSIRDIIKETIILRSVTTKTYVENEFLYKQKEFDSKGNIIKQDKTECKILNIDEGINFLKIIGFQKLMNIKEYDSVYKRDNLEIVIKEIDGGDILIEIEENEEFNTIERLKQKIIELNLPIDKSNFFVKKAEIELKKILGD